MSLNLCSRGHLSVCKTRAVPAIRSDLRVTDEVLAPPALASWQLVYIRTGPECGIASRSQTCGRLLQRATNRHTAQHQRSGVPMAAGQPARRGSRGPGGVTGWVLDAIPGGSLLGKRLFSLTAARHSAAQREARPGPDRPPRTAVARPLHAPPTYGPTNPPLLDAF